MMSHQGNLAGQFGDTTYTKVFVGGLAWETHKDTMKKYFEQFGDILEAVVITDKATGKSKGYGFVRFHSSPYTSHYIIITCITITIYTHTAARPLDLKLFQQY